MTYRKLIAAISDLQEKVNNFDKVCSVYGVFLGLLDDDDAEFENLRPAEFNRHIKKVCKWMSIHADDEIIGDFNYMKTRCNDLYDLVDLMKHFKTPYDMRKIFSDFIEKERKSLVKHLDKIFEDHYYGIEALLAMLKKYVQQDLEALKKKAENDHHRYAFDIRRLQGIIDECNLWHCEETELEADD